ncbi:MAG: rRNA maturation RNase YbeY [Candidatus Paceibacterota bacterium]|jgi:probable rRNA maturation factor
MEKKFEEIKNDILGKRYSLSIGYVSEEESKRINKKYRNKNKPANVLSFPFSNESGEILLCPDTIKRDTKKFSRTFPELLQFMVIHGMLHLKGMQHSSRMEREEDKYDKKYLYRNRSRLCQDKGSGRRNNKRRKKS